MKNKEKREDQFWLALSITEFSSRAPFFPKWLYKSYAYAPEEEGGGGGGRGVPKMNGIYGLVIYYTRNYLRTLAIFTGCVPISPERCYFSVGWQLDLDFLKLNLFNNSSNLNKGNHKRDGDFETWSKLAEIFAILFLCFFRVK